MSLLALAPTDPRWSSTIDDLPGAGPFHHPAWSAHLEATYGYRLRLMVLAGGSGARAALPLARVAPRFSAPRLVALPFTDHLAPLCRDTDALRELVIRLERDARREGLPLELRWQADPAHALPDYVLHLLPLATEEELLGRAHRTRVRQPLARARAAGLVVDVDAGKRTIDRWYHLLTATRRRHGAVPQPHRFIEGIGGGLAPIARLVTISRPSDGEMLAGSLFLAWGDRLVYKYNASSEEGRRLGANHLALVEGMRWGRERGCVLLDFGRSDLDATDLRAFKSAWGASEQPLAYTRLGAVAPRRGAPPRLAGQVVRHLPHWACRAIGELAYGRFG